MNVRIELRDGTWMVAGERFDRVYIDNKPIERFLRDREIVLRDGEYLSQPFQTCTKNNGMCVIKTP